MRSYDDAPTGAPRQLGRRAVTRGAAWSIPVVSVAAAAPAMAATSGGCTVQTGKLAWTSQITGSLFGKVLVTTVSGVTVSVTAVGDTHAANNGITWSGSVGGVDSMLLLHSQNGTRNTSQTLTITFSVPVQNLSFTFVDIDSSRSGNRFIGYTDHWQDLVSVLPAPTSQTKGATVQGSGTAGSPWRAVTKNTPVPDSGTTADVTVSWAAPRSSVTIVYAQDGTQDGSPKVGIGDLSFQTVCP